MTFLRCVLAMLGLVLCLLFIVRTALTVAYSKNLEIQYSTKVDTGNLSSFLMLGFHDYDLAGTVVELPRAPQQRFEIAKVLLENPTGWVCLTVQRTEETQRLLKVQAGPCKTSLTGPPKHLHLF